MDILINIAKTALALLIVLALAYLVLRNGNSFLAKDSGIIGIVEKVALSNNAFLAVARVGKEYHLISVNNGEIRILKELDAGEVQFIIEEKKKLMEGNPLNGMMNRRRNGE